MRIAGVLGIYMPKRSRVQGSPKTQVNRGGVDVVSEEKRAKKKKTSLDVIFYTRDVSLTRLDPKTNQSIYQHHQNT